MDGVFDVYVWGGRDAASQTKAVEPKTRVVH